MSESIESKLARLVAAPKPYGYRVTYADGNQRMIPCVNLAAAMHGAEREARNMGRPLVDRSTGATTRKIRVEVVRLI